MTKEIILTNGAIAFVNDEDFERINQYKWTYMTGRGYALRSEYISHCKITKKLKKKSILMHREIMGSPEGKSVDHRDGNFLNNQKSNLRVCDQINNTQSRRKQKPGILFN